MADKQRSRIRVSVSDARSKGIGAATMPPDPARQDVGLPGDGGLGAKARANQHVAAQLAQDRATVASKRPK